MERPQQQITPLQQRIVVFSTAVQDFMAIALELQKENEGLKQEIELLKAELKKKKKELKSRTKRT